MTDGWRTGLILGALGLSLILNIVALMRINDLRSDLDLISGQAAQVSNLQMQIDEAEHRINELAEQQEWIADVNWMIDLDEFDGACDAEVPISASWTFRELSDNADVFLEMRQAGAGDWLRTPAEQVGDVEFRSQLTLEIAGEWEYRIVADGDEDTRVSVPEPVYQLTQLTDQRIMFEHGETRSQDGLTWIRYFAGPMVEQISPCNEIVDATLTVFDRDSASETVPLQYGHPGDHLPESYEPEDERDPETAFDEAIPAPDTQEMSPGGEYWWTDWIRVENGPPDVELTVEFGDGATRVYDRRGPN